MWKVFFVAHVDSNVQNHEQNLEHVVVWPHSRLQPSSPSLRPVNPTSRVRSAVSPAVGGVHFKKNGSNGNCKMLVWMLILHVSLWFLTFLSLTHAMKMHESCVKSAGSPGVASDKAPSTTAFLGSAKPWWRWNFREHQLEVGFKTFCFCDTPKLLSEELLSNIYVASKSQAVKIESAKIILYQNTCSWTSSNSTWEVLEYWTNAS